MWQKLFPFPVSFFAMALGLTALGLAWRYGADTGQFSSFWGGALLTLAVLLWLFLVWGYTVKWLRFREKAQEELHNLVQCCFISLVPITTILTGTALWPLSHGLAWLLWTVGIIAQLWFAAWRSAGLWRGLHTPGATTPIVYLPTVAAAFVSAVAMSVAGHPQVGALFLGMGVLSWFSVEAVILQRLRTLPPLDPAARPVLGIQLAPPFVGCAAYLAVNGGTVDMLALAFIGYGCLQFLFLLRLLPWIAEKGFSPAFWAFSFGLASMTACGLRLTHQFPAGDMAVLGSLLCWIGNGGIALLTLLTIRFFWRMHRAA